MSDAPIPEDFLAAIEQGCWGRFPFGQPNTRRPPTRPTDTSGPALAVLGVYPSALHLSWRSPDATDGKPTIAALAVDVEPEVFWSGDSGDDQATRIAEWKTATHDDGTRGSFGWVHLNGTSGLRVAKDYLAPLGFTYAQCFLTDCVPFYFVKPGEKEQGGKIRSAWQPVADAHGWPGGDLPTRPTMKTLVAMAAHPARALADELASAHADAIITLGQEAADALARVVTVTIAPPGLPLSVEGDIYGTPGRITLAGRKVTWIPLAHPGATGRDGTPWHTRHESWKARVARNAK